MAEPAVMPRLKKSWHVTRRRWGADVPVPRRLAVKKARWLLDARSPVMLGIDDLTNAWQARADTGTWENGGDWGGRQREPGSALSFLEEHLMADFPEVRITFFTVAGPISAYTHHQPFSHAAPLDASRESSEFFRALSQDSRYELAYHGLNHGTSGARTEEFVQEFRGFASLDAAIAQTRRGLDIFERATGTIPRGGKYGGYEYNEFSEAVLEACGFDWWCRDWLPCDVTSRVPSSCYEPQFFGERLLVALPSNIHGQLWDTRQIDRLLSGRHIISIAEHIAPVRPDGRTQTPNIVDDIRELRRLYRYLRNESVWHARASDVASYVVAREHSVVYDVTRDGFSIRYNGSVQRPLLTLKIACAALCTVDRPHIVVEAPNGTAVDPSACRFDRDRYDHLITIPVMNGRYRVCASAN